MASRVKGLSASSRERFDGLGLVLRRSNAMHDHGVDLVAVAQVVESSAAPSFPSRDAVRDVPIAVPMPPTVSFVAHSGLRNQSPQQMTLSAHSRMVLRASAQSRPPGMARRSASCSRRDHTGLVGAGRSPGSARSRSCSRARWPIRVEVHEHRGGTSRLRADSDLADAAAASRRGQAGPFSRNADSAVMNC